MKGAGGIALREPNSQPGHGLALSTVNNSRKPLPPAGRRGESRTTAEGGAGQTFQ